jgi:S1-C subfamily serine protease
VKDGDIITKINDVTVDTLHPLDAVLSQFSPGDTVTLTILRDGKTRPSRSRSACGPPASASGWSRAGRSADLDSE